MEIAIAEAALSAQGTAVTGNPRSCTVGHQILKPLQCVPILVKQEQELVPTVNMTTMRNPPTRGSVGEKTSAFPRKDGPKGFILGHTLHSNVEPAHYYTTHHLPHQYCLPHAATRRVARGNSMPSFRVGNCKDSGICGLARWGDIRALFGLPVAGICFTLLLF